MKQINILLLIASFFISTIAYSSEKHPSKPALQYVDKSSAQYKVLVQRATQAAVWGMPAVALIDFVKATRRDLKGDFNDVVYLTKPLNSKHGFLTANDVTAYGWGSLDFVPGVKDDKYFENSDLWEGDELHFEHFVHPDLAQAFYSENFVLMKALLERVTHEAKEYRKRNKMYELLLNIQHTHSESEEGESEPKKVNALESKLVLPPLEDTRYPLRGIEESGLRREYLRNPGTSTGIMNLHRYAAPRVKLLKKVKERLQTLTRAVDLAFFLHGFDGARRPGNEIDARWRVPEWSRDVRETDIVPRTNVKGHRVPTRNRYSAIPLGDKAALLYRIRPVAVQVKA